MTLVQTHGALALEYEAIRWVPSTGGHPTLNSRSVLLRRRRACSATSMAAVIAEAARGDDVLFHVPAAVLARD